MSPMTPEETEAARARVAAIDTQLRIGGPVEPGTVAYSLLLLELNELYLQLGEFSVEEAERNEKGVRQEIAEMEAAERRSMELAREPSEAEIVMADFADRLAARQGTFIPDFRSLFERKAELDRKLMDP